MMTRRDLLAGTGVLLAGWTTRICAASEIPAAGCQLMAPVDRLGLGSESVVPTVQADRKLITSSGNANLDHYLGRALLRLANEFEVYPGFSFFDDSDSENALATRETKIPGTKGTVIFGVNLFRDALHNFHDQGVAVIAVCAHEFGHIFQYKSGFYDKLTTGEGAQTVKLVELHADYLAGYYLAGRKSAYPDLDLQGAGALFESLGDTKFNNPAHHGTSAQRVAAIEAGFKFGRKSDQPILAAAAAGAEFVLEEFG
jgi:hypothetical protein